MELKVGDKIRLIGNVGDWIIGSEGVINEVRPPEREYHYQAYIHVKKSDRHCYYPLRDGEVEKVSKKGRQLLFSFMEQ